MGKLYLFNVYAFCKSLCVINVVSPYGLHGFPIYILYLYDQMWLVWLIYIYEYDLVDFDEFRAGLMTENNLKDVQQAASSPMMCKGCHDFGHPKKNSKRDITICGRCNGADHTGCDCNSDTVMTAIPLFGVVLFATAIPLFGC